MKSVTEFQSFTLNQGLKTKATLAAEGKSAEEIQAGLGEAFKYEGDKLKHFVSALEVAEKNAEGLKRVLVVTLAEGEQAPQKAIQVEAHHYIPEFLVTVKPAGDTHKGKGGGRGRKLSGPKGSPWGLSPEEKAAKNAGKGGGKAAPAKA